MGVVRDGLWGVVGQEVQVESGKKGVGESAFSRATSMMNQSPMLVRGTDGLLLVVWELKLVDLGHAEFFIEGNACLRVFDPKNRQ